MLSGWLEGTMPVLPSGVQLRLTEEKKSYGLEDLLAESHRIFSLAEQTGDSMILCLTGAAGSGREYAMEQICAGQDLALLLIDGETFRGTERELNACILSVMLYEAYPCVWLGKTERWELLKKMRESFSFYGVIREEGRALAERPEASVITRKLEQPDRKLKQPVSYTHLDVYKRQAMYRWNILQSIRRSKGIMKVRCRADSSAVTGL